MKIKLMKTFLIHVGLVSVLSMGSCSSGLQLFEENSSDWEQFGEAEWQFSDGELVGEVANGKAGFVMTDQSYDNFILELEFMPDQNINSGVYFRCGKKDINIEDCYELNIWDSNPNQDYRTGALVTKSNALEIVDTTDKWNTYKVKAEDGHIQAWVNGILTTDITDTSLSEGYIGLQALGSGKIKFRKISIKEL